MHLFSDTVLSATEPVTGPPILLCQIRTRTMKAAVLATWDGVAALDTIDQLVELPYC